MEIGEDLCQKWLEEACQFLSIPIPTLTIVNKLRGGAVRSRLGEQVFYEVFLPVGALQQNESFVKYYLVHECTHLKEDTATHDQQFKEAEANNLTQIFNIGIKYNRSFPAALSVANAPTTMLWSKARQ